jgi:class 3 adenylate cyclase
MTANNLKKNPQIRWLASFLPAGVVAALLCIILDGPRLGFVYDFLLALRPSRSVSEELLIIDSSMAEWQPGDDILEPRAASSLLYTMTELGARTLIIQVPILGLSAGGTIEEEEILSRFDEEFSVLTRNIRKLFEAIRTGSIAPMESARYVGELVELSEMGKERLVSALIYRDEEGITRMEEAAALFGHVRRAGDFQVQLIRSGENGQPGVLAESGEYSRALPDWDGVIRRLAPVVTVADPSAGQAGERMLEHIIYAALKTRYKDQEILISGSNPTLILRSGPDGTDRIIPLDRYGSVLFGLSQKRANIRRVGISDFLAYDEADRNFRQLLLEAEAFGIFRGIAGENHPGILYDYAFSVREEPALSFQNRYEEKRLAWIEARNRYFASLDDIINGPTEVNLVEAYELQIASEPHNSANITEMRNSLIRFFASLRERYKEVIDIRNKLESSLSSSFCILGSSTDTQASALLANSILTGRAVKPGKAGILLLLTLLSVFLTHFLVNSREPASSLMVGLFLTLLIGTAFSVFFIFSGLWLDPQVPVAANAISILISSVMAFVAKNRYSRVFRLSYGPFISRSCLESVIQAGEPLPSQTVKTVAVAVAVKKANLASSDDPGSSNGELSAASLVAFQKEVSDTFRKAGATITGIEGSIVTVCFGSPLERAAINEKEKLPPNEAVIFANEVNAGFAQRAVDLISKISRRHESASWEFGIDTGSCSFSWTEVSGYSAIGVPVQRAKILAHLAGRYKTHIVVSAAMNKALPGLHARKLGDLKRKDGSVDEAFFRLGE